MNLRLYENQYSQHEYVPISFTEYLRRLREAANLPCTPIEEVAGKKDRQQFLKALDENELATAVILDFDKLTRSELKQVIAHAEAIGFTCMIHSTSQSTATAPRFRIIYPIRPGHIDVAASINALAYPVACDQNAVGLNRGWYLPSVHAQQLQIKRIKGEFVQPVYVNAERVLNKIRNEVPDNPIANATDRSTELENDVLEDDASGKAGMSDLQKLLAPAVTRAAEARRQEADAWLCNWLESRAYTSLGRQTNAGTGHIGYEMNCPRCDKSGAGIVLDIANGRIHIRCRHTSCGHRDTVYTTKTASYDILSPELVIGEASAGFTIKQLRGVSARWWIRDDTYYKEESVLSAICGLTGILVVPLRTAARRFHKAEFVTGPVDFPWFNDEILNNAVAVLKDSGRRTGQTINESLFRNLYCLAAKSNKPMDMIVERLTPMHWQRLDSRNWRTPTATFSSEMMSRKASKRRSQPIALDAILCLGYSLLSPIQLAYRLRALPPYIFIDPSPITEAQADESRVVMLKQRILLALARGCNVYLTFPCTRDQMHTYMSRLGIPRNRSISLSQLFRR